MKKTKLRILAGAVLGVGLAGALFFNVFQIRHIQVAGNTRYTKDEIKEMIADDKWVFNTVLLTTFHSKVDMSEIPFLNSIEYSFVNYNTIRVNVNEKKVVGYVEYENQKVYFDKNGIVLECVSEENAASETQNTEENGTDASSDGSLSSEPISASTDSASDGKSSSATDGALTADSIKSARVTASSFQPSLSDVPLVTGLVFDHVTVNEQLPVEKPAVFRTMLALTRMTEKYHITPESVEFTENGEIILHYYGTVRILLGTDSALEEKMTRVAAILPSLSGLSGELHMEDYREGDDSFVFSKDTETQAAGQDAASADNAQNGDGQNAAAGQTAPEETADHLAAAETGTADANAAENAQTGDTAENAGADPSYDNAGDTTGDGTYDDTADTAGDGTYDDATDTTGDGTYDDTADTAGDGTYYDNTAE